MGESQRDHATRHVILHDIERVWNHRHRTRVGIDLVGSRPLVAMPALLRCGDNPGEVARRIEYRPCAVGCAGVVEQVRQRAGAGIDLVHTAARRENEFPAGRRSEVVRGTGRGKR